MKKFLNIFGKFSKWLLPAICLLILIILIAEPSLAKVPADTADTKTFLVDFDKLGSMISGFFATIGSVVIIIIVFLSFLMALALGNLMDSTFILDSGMGETLHLIWTVVRNFVNVGFILLLLIMAAMVVLGLGDEGGTGTLKKVLPKFIISLVAVNLTFFGARVILTVNDVLATAIFSLPRVVSGDKHIRMPCKPPEEAGGKTCEKQIEEVLTKKFENVDDPKGVWTSIVGAENTLFKKESWVSHTIKSFVSRKNMSLVLLTNMADIEHIIFTKGRIGNGSDLTVSLIGGMIMAGAVGFIFTMLALAFVVRMVVLWIVIAFSPVAALGIVIKELFGFEMGGGDLDPMEIFMTHAFMSTLVAIPLSVGMIMIFANNAIGYGDFSLKNLLSFSELGGTGFSLLWWLAAVVIVWFGTNEALEKSKFASKVSKPIFDTVGGFVEDIGSLVKYAPILPKWAGGSINSLKTAPSLARTKLEASNAPNREGLAKVIASSVPGYKEAPTSTSTLTNNITNIKETDETKRQEAVFEKYKDAASNNLDLSSNAERALKDFLKKTFTLAEAGIESSNTHKEILNAIKDKYGNTTDQQIDHIFETAERKKKEEGDKTNNKENISEHEGKKIKKSMEEGDTKDKLIDKDKKVYTDEGKVSDGKNGETVVLLKDSDGKEYYATKAKDKEEYEIISGKEDLGKSLKKIGDAEDDNQSMNIIKKLPKKYAEENKKEIQAQLLQRLDSGDIKVKEIDNWEDLLTNKEQLGYELLTKKEFEETIEKSKKFKKEGDAWRPKSE